MISKTKLTVRYQETDQMGVVHHSVYPIWFECGRTDLIKLAGMNYGQLEKEGVKLPLLNMKCQYFAPTYYEDVIHVKTKILTLTPTRISFRYEVIRNNIEKSVVAGETEHVWVNTALKPINMKKYKPELYQTMAKLYVAEKSIEDGKQQE